MIRAACLLLTLTACGSSSAVSIDTREWACTAWATEKVESLQIAGKAAMPTVHEETVCLRWTRMKGTAS